MVAKMIRVSLLIGVFFFSVVHLPVSAGQDDWWDDSWSFRQELSLDSVTSKESAANQPVDTTIRFESSCWVENETHHSVRVICQNKDDDIELESQLYALEYLDEAHITSCNLVFLIPPQTDGTEKYYVYYDESPTTSPNYPDHVSIADSAYFYEPIPGYPLESHFYKITQQDTIRYVVAQEGQFLWYSTSQYVTKLQEGSTEVMPKNGETIASFEYSYYYGDEMWQFNSTSQKLITKEILCDGNLMVSCKILSRSNGDDLQTTAIYKYYYCPTSSERIQVHVVHETLKECQMYPDSNTDGTYASLQCGGIQSASIADLNFGEIYPYSHFYSEQNSVEEYKVDLHPEYTQENPVLWLIQTPDDVDIGKKPWVSFDEGTTGNVHALLFGSSSVVKAGRDERDGMQLKAYESNYPHFPGLDYAVAGIECTRNSYEKNVAGKDMIIPKGFTAEFDAEFFSSPIGGYLLAEKEEDIFQALVPLKPFISDNQSSEKNTSADRFSLTVFVHAAPSFPLGSVLSVVTGRDFPFITVEVYRDDELMSSGTAGRLPIKGSGSSERVSLKEKIHAIIQMVDLHNVSFFKAVHFQQLEVGRYVIKVFKENPRVGTERHFIGYMIVDLTKDSQIHIFCKQQVSCLITLVDQEGTGIKNADVMLFQDGMEIAHNTTNDDGVVLLTAPRSQRDPYQLKIISQGFEVVNESIRLRYYQIVVPLKRSVTLDQYDWTLTLIDLWGLPPEINVTPRITSAVMQTPTVIFPEQNPQSSFQFRNLLPATYLLQIQYKSFVLEKEIQIPSNDESLVFPAEYQVSFNVFDSRGSTLEDVKLQMSRGGKIQETTSNGSKFVFSIPPGQYLVTVISQGDVIGQRVINVANERSVDLITNRDPIFPLIGLILACILGLIGLAVGIKKKEPLFCLLLFMVGILVIALLFPWWSLQGSSAGIETSSTFYLIPLNLVSLTTTPQVIVGELSFFPEIFKTIMMIIPVLSVIVSLLAISALGLKRIQKKQWQSLLLVGALLLLFCSLFLFIGAMSAFAEVGVGSFIGSGTLDISIQGQEVVVPVLCQWGPGIGFWLYVVAGMILSASLIIILYQKNKKSNQLL
jgi:hypothetical protein